MQRTPFDKGNFTSYSVYNKTNFDTEKQASDSNQVLEKPEHLKKLHDLEKENRDLSNEIKKANSKIKKRDREISRLQNQFDLQKQDIEDLFTQVKYIDEEHKKFLEKQQQIYNRNQALL